MKDQIANPISQIGYIEPCHGVRGKQRWLSSDADLEEIYKINCAGKKEVILWTFKALPDSDRKQKVLSDAQNTEDVSKAKKVPMRLMWTRWQRLMKYKRNYKKYILLIIVSNN